MLLIDRYLLRQFIQIFFICFCSLTGLYIVIDAFGNLDDFMKFAGQGGSLLAIMGEYYGYRTIGFFDRTSGMLTLIAAMFTLATFQRFNELTALQAAGVAKWRIVRPIIVAVAVISLVAALNREIVIPTVRERFTRNAQDLGGDVGKELQPRLDNRTDILIRGKQTFANDQRIEKPSFMLPINLAVYGTQLNAADAFFRKATDEHPTGYLFAGVSQPKDLADKPSLKVGDETVIFMPADYAWLQPDECFVASEVTFEHLTSGSDWRQNASLPELIAGLKNPSLGFGADVQVAIHARVVQPLLDMTLLFLGIPLVLSRNNRNLFIAVGWCLVVVVLFYLVVLAFQYLGSSYLISPVLGAWAPLLIFVPVAVALSDPLRE